MPCIFALLRIGLVLLRRQRIRHGNRTQASSMVVCPAEHRNLFGLCPGASFGLVLLVVQGQTRVGLMSYGAGSPLLADSHAFRMGIEPFDLSQPNDVLGTGG